MDKSILVTGGSGWIGSMLIPDLGRRGYTCVNYDLASGQDIFDTKTLAKEMRGCSAVIHLAGIHGPLRGKTEEDYRHINYEGSKSVVDTASKVGIKRLVFASSNDIYGYSVGITPKYPITRKTKTPPLKVLHPYAKYKLMTEAYFRKIKGMTIISLRLGGIGAPAEVPWRISIENLGKAFAHALEMDGGFRWFNAADPGCSVEVSRDLYQGR